MQDYINAYNDRPHSGILDYSPNEANEHAADLVELNTEKSIPVENKFNIGDLVRKKLKKPIFSKGYKQIWSNRTYTIKNIEGIHAILNDDSKVRLDSLQKIVKELETIPEESEIDKVDKESKVEKIIKHREGLDSENIIESRLRKK